MVRQRPRKSVEELYGTKFDAPPKNQPPNNTMAKNMRTDRDFGGYIITSNTGYNASCAQSNSTSASMPQCGALPTSRRKTARTSQAKQEKFFPNEEKVLNLDNVKKDSNNRSKTTRAEKTAPNMYQANPYDGNKNYANFPDPNAKEAHVNNHHTHHHHQAVHQEEDKDDDTEEFFELIRQTVENAIGKSISDLLNRNFRELSAKIDRFSSELKATNNTLSKLQTEVNNKVVHYGEENSRHFRYLCMKSEYDKMFYQHHTMLASNSSVDKRSSVPKMSVSKDCDKVKNPCTCRSSKTLPSDPHKTSSEEHDVSAKSSEMGMREVIEHIQRFCNQMQFSDVKTEDRMPKNTFRLEDALKLNKQVFEDEDDDFQISSDGMTPRSDDNIPKYSGGTGTGGQTMRSVNTARGAGAGDA